MRHSTEREQSASQVREQPGLGSDLKFKRDRENIREWELDAALVSITEVLFNDSYDILDGIAIASLGEVYSVLLAHKKPLEEVKEIFCDTASLTGLNLMKVLLAERNLFPEFKPLDSYKNAVDKDFVLLIGDPAIDNHRRIEHLAGVLAALFAPEQSP